MQHESRLVAVLLLTSQIQLAVADAYYTGNPASAYPPGCINGPLRDLDLAGENTAMFFSDRIWLEVVHRVEPIDAPANLGEVQLDMYRVACAEPNRSVIIAEFRLTPEWVDPRNAQLVLPWLGGNTGMDPYPFEFKPEPNTSGRSFYQSFFTKMAIGDYTGGWDDPRRFRWRYVLDVPSPGIGDRDDGPNYYNGQFTLLFYRSNGAHFLSVVVPATEALLEPETSLPLSGRLSGNWIEEGSADQGLLISFSSAPTATGVDAQPPEQTDLVLFLSWFTFDGRGDMLWLTGASRFAQGSTDTVVPIERVTGGAFLGATPAQRATVGTARLSAVQCNRLELEYDLDALGLGSGVMHLQRLFALEIADYPCRDYEALQSSIFPHATN